jgi:hypothetical protein
VDAQCVPVASPKHENKMLLDRGFSFENYDAQLHQIAQLKWSATRKMKMETRLFSKTLNSIAKLN